ncbi:MAG: hypothetical protein Q7R43_06430 [Candidatus Daviesbacteria bacterium]|nr:hypothetical protein [Candidatus Daviesbacteria bacterium]
MSTTGPSASELGIDLSKEASKIQTPLVVELPKSPSVLSESNFEPDTKEVSPELPVFTTEQITEYNLQPGIMYKSPEFNLEASKGYLIGTAKIDELDYIFEIDPQTKQVMKRIPGVGGGSGLIPDIDPGLTTVDFRKRIRDNIAFLEKNRGAITPELITAWANNIAAYAGINLDEKIKMQSELEARLYSAAADLWLIKSSYENFSNFFINMGKDHFNSLRDEVLGVPGMEIVRQMEIGNGLYWRESKANRDAADGRFKNNLMLTGITAEEAEGKLNIIKRLFHTSGMSSFYTGPIRETTFATPGAVHLLAQDWMVHSLPPQVRGVDTANVALLEDQPHLVYQRNEKYWRQVDQSMDGRVGNLDRSGNPNNQIIFAADDDPATNMRRLLYLPIELDNVARKMGIAAKTWSLHRAGETYAVTLPQLSGFGTLGEFMGAVNDEVGGVDQPDKNKRDKVKGRMFAYAGMIKGAGEAASAIMNFMNEPIQGGETAGDDLNRSLKNMSTVIEKLGYLSMRSPNVLSVATARILTATFGWANGNSRDRWQNFPKVPRFGKKTENAVVKVFAANMFEEDLKRVLSGVGATDTSLRLQEGRESSIGYLGDLLGLLSKIFK